MWAILRPPAGVVDRMKHISLTFCVFCIWQFNTHQTLHHSANLAGEPRTPATWHGSRDFSLAHVGMEQKPVEILATWFVGTGLAILCSQYVKLIEFVRKVTYSSPRLQIIYSSFSWYLAMCSPPTVSHPSGKKNLNSTDNCQKSEREKKHKT